MVETAMRTTCDMVSIEQKTTSRLDFDQDELLDELASEYKLLEALAQIGDIFPINLSSDLSLDATASYSIESQNAQWAQGEFFIRGLNVIMGHQDNPEVNKTAFQFGWFRIGDLGYLKKLWEEVRKTVFVVRQTESKGDTSRVYVRGVHATEELTYNAAIANFICILQQEDRSTLSKVCELGKTTTLSYKDHLRSVQSCQDPVTEHLGEIISSEMENVTLLCIEGRTASFACVWPPDTFNRCLHNASLQRHKCKVTDKMKSVAHPNWSRNDDAYELEHGDNEFSGSGVKKTPFLHKQAMPS
ncbi:hypothetical protein SUGI_1010800 [Cryptomeria japonica]|nr:hypothetical protein SUGI_1010800 [Cryptomeria japonica]